MSSVLYRNFLRLLERWPVDATKKGRDLGEYIRSGVGAAFRAGSDEPRDTLHCEEIYTRLSNIAGNKYKEAFYASKISSASGLGQQECQQIVSKEFLEFIEKENKTWKEKLVQTIRKEDR